MIENALENDGEEKPPKELYLYFDDSGSRYPDAKPPERNDGIDCFALGGVLVRPEDEQQIVAAYLTFCKKWGIKCPLHSTKIRGMRGGFGWLKTDPERCNAFLSELETLMCGQPFQGLATLVHRPGYRRRYEKEYNERLWLMDKTAFSILIERAAIHARKNDRILRIVYERSGPKEDAAIIEFYGSLKTDGMPFSGPDAKKYGGLSAREFEQVVPFKPSGQTKATIMLQVADLYLYAMVKSGYDQTYRTFVSLKNADRILHCQSDEATQQRYGVKYSCFDTPEKNEGDRR